MGETAIDVLWVCRNNCICANYSCIDVYSLCLSAAATAASLVTVSNWKWVNYSSVHPIPTGVMKGKGYMYMRLIRGKHAEYVHHDDDDDDEAFCPRQVSHDASR